MCMCVYIHIYIYIYIYICVCVYVCIYIYIYIYTHSSLKNVGLFGYRYGLNCKGLHIAIHAKFLNLKGFGLSGKPCGTRSPASWMSTWTL